jgi:anti-sigma factor RsiW
MGAYLVGALDGEARARLIRHLETCAGCRMDYDDLVPVRGLLSQLAGPGGAARDGEPGEGGYGERAPGGPPLPALRPVRGRPVRGRPVRRRAGRRWLAGAAVAVAGAAVAVLAAVGLGRSAPTFRAFDHTTGVHGAARLHAAPTGAEIELTVAGLPAGERCVMMAVSARGSDVAGTWNATYDGMARVAGTSAIPVGRLTALRIESGSGRLLLNIPV